MFYVYSNIQKYGSSEHHSGLIDRVSRPAGVFLNIVSRTKDSWPGLLCWLFMYVDQVKQYVIAKIHKISNIDLHYLINSNVLNVGFLIYQYNA